MFWKDGQVEDMGERIPPGMRRVEMHALPRLLVHPAANDVPRRLEEGRHVDARQVR